MSENRTMRLRTAAAWLAGGALAVGVLAGCGSSAGSAPAASASTPASSSAASSPAASSPAVSSSAGGTMPATATMIMIENFRFQVPATVAPGSTVSVMNMDGEAHTVTADTGKAFDVVSPAGKTVTFTAPSTPGSYPFHCLYHGGMQGVLVVG